MSYAPNFCSNKAEFFYYECGCLKLPISAVTKQDFLLSMQLMSIALKVCSNQAAFLTKNVTYVLNFQFDKIFDVCASSLG